MRTSRYFTYLGLIVGIIIMVLAAKQATSEKARPAVTPVAVTNSTRPAPTNQAVSYQGDDGKTVLELLEKSHTVEKKESAFGAFVQSIDGVKGTDSQGWLFYIDGQAGQTAANKTATQSNQTVEWRYEKFQ